MPKPKVWSAERSSKNLRGDATKLARSTNAMWGIATKTPYFLRKARMVGTGKNKKRATMMRMGTEVPVPVKTNRCVRKAAVKTLLSAAAMNAASVLGDEADTMRTEVDGEVAVAAALPVLSKGAELALEHALVAYTQSIFDVAVRIKDTMSMHSKVTSNCMSAAAEIVNDAVFSSSTLAPGAVTVDVPKKRKRGATKPNSTAATTTTEPTVATAD